MTVQLILPVVLIGIFLVLGITWFSPEMRLKFLLWRGKERKAGKLIEHMIERNPERINLYGPLGKIYFLENRRDKKAVKVFETILQLKIPFQWREAILPIVAKYYIREGRKDSDAINVIEKAVESELDRLKW